MAQDPLFPAPPARLPGPLHEQLFGGLPSSVGRALDAPAVAAAVRPLLTAGWRPGQLASRVGALTAADDPVPGVLALLQALAHQPCPQEQWQQDRASRRGAPSSHHPVASEQVRAHWIAEARRSLGLPPRARPVERPKPVPRCACCSADATFFVTREVRLCAECVAVLGSGRARLAVGA